MKTICGCAITATLVTILSVPALATEPEAETGGVPMHEHSGTVRPPAQEPALQQQVTGTVADITADKGLLALTAPDGVLKLHFPPGSIRDVRIGDTITVQYAIAKAGASAGSMRAYDAPAGLGEHKMTGTVLMVDHEKGGLQVKTDETVLALRFPPAALQNLNAGERITIDLAYSKHDVTSK